MKYLHRRRRAAGLAYKGMLGISGYELVTWFFSYFQYWKDLSSSFVLFQLSKDIYTLALRSNFNQGIAFDPLAFYWPWSLALFDICLHSSVPKGSKRAYFSFQPITCSPSLFQIFENTMIHGNVCLIFLWSI